MCEGVSFAPRLNFFYLRICYGVGYGMEMDSYKSRFLGGHPGGYGTILYSLGFAMTWKWIRISLKSWMVS
jgi:hypothetical protein